MTSSMGAAPPRRISPALGRALAALSSPAFRMGLSAGLWVAKCQVAFRPVMVSANKAVDKMDIRELIGLPIAAAFFGSTGLAGYLLLTNPEGVTEWADRKGIFIPFLQLTKTRMGKIQVRVLGFVFLAASVLMPLVIILRRI